MKKKLQRGYTLTELLFVVWGCICLSAVVALIWVICHFIAKFW